ncbi:MAG: DUF6364 family protein [Candidatus Korobacteraceae bacterium]
MSAKVTLRIDSKVLREARSIAAEESTTVSGLVTNFLASLRHGRRRYSGPRCSSGSHPPRTAGRANGA